MTNKGLKLSFKTKILNSVRLIFRNPIGERIIKAFTIGKNPDSWICKLVPNHYQYPPHSIREVATSEQIQFKLDISDIIDWFIYFGFRELSKEKLLEQAKGSKIILDVGANVGEISLRLALDKSATVYSFEPDPVNFQRLTTNLQLNKFQNIIPINKGLGSKSGTELLHTETINNRGRNKITDTPKENSVNIDIITIDGLVAQEKISKIDFIKIDVEGYEQNVLMGAIETIHRDRPILFIEIDDLNLRNQRSSAQILIDELLKNGYSVKSVETDEIINIDTNFENCHFDVIATPIEAN